MNPYQFRQKVRAAWTQDFNIKYAMILKTSDRFETISSLKTFATELGARAIILEIDGELDEQQIDFLKRKGPRIVIIIGIETMPPEAAAALPAMINAGGRAMPVILWIVPEEEAETESNEDQEALAA